jgi:hypothetical protein
MGLKVNFSSEEASSEARKPIPRGYYHVKITDIDLRESQSEKNNGKPYWGIEFTVQDGEYADKKVWTNCMLFEGALYTFSQLMKALGYDVRSGEFEVPDPEDLISRDVVVRVTIRPERTVGDKNYDESNEVKSIAPWVEGTKLSSVAGGGAKKKAGSLLP